MSRTTVFILGLAVGLVAGVGGTLAWPPAGPAALPLAPGPTDAPDRPTARAPGPTPDALPPVPAAAPERAARTAPPAPRPEAADTAAARAALDAALRRDPSAPTPQRVQRWRDRARHMVDWDADDPRYRGWFVEALEDLRDPDPAVAEAAGYALAWAGMQERFSPDQLTELEAALPGLLEHQAPDSARFEEHHYGRSLELDPPVETADPAAWVAWILAFGRKDPAALEALLARVPTDRFPSVHLALLFALRERAGDAHRRYLLALTRDATNGRVLSEAWDAGRVGALATRVWAADFLRAVDQRVVAGMGSAHMRWCGWRAAAVAGLQVADAAAATLTAAAERESDAGVAAFLRAAAEGLAGGSLGPGGVELLAMRHTPSGR